MTFSNLIILGFISVQFLSVANAEELKFYRPDAKAEIDAMIKRLDSKRLKFNIICTPEQEARLSSKDISKDSECLSTSAERAAVKIDPKVLAPIAEYLEERKNPRAGKVITKTDKLMAAIVDQDLKLSAAIDQLEKDTREGRLPARLKDALIARAKRVFSLESLYKPFFLVGVDLPAMNPKWLSESGGIYDKKAVQKPGSQEAGGKQNHAPSSAQK